MSLYIRHRPEALSEIRGNRNLVTTLKGMLEDIPNLPHTFLLHGPTGCGKTTLARILANALECTKLNLIEIDTAQFTGIDTVRDIRTKAQYLPLGGGVRVFIIDEVQKMTTPAQHAFLKILEDTPKHIYFILCTTEPKSLLPTVRGRCSTFQVKQLTEAQMKRLLIEVAEKEGGATLTDVVLDAIIDSAGGHPRNALTILEQVLATPERKREEVAKQAQIAQTEGFKLAQLLLRKAKWKEVTPILQGLKQEDAEGLRRLIMAVASGVLLKGENDQAAYMLECFQEPLYNSLFPGLVYACYQIIN